MITATQLRQWLNEYESEQISFSRLLELVNEKRKKFEIGMIVIVTDCISAHGFDIEEIVKIIDCDELQNSFLCQNENGDKWRLSESEIEIANPTLDFSQFKTK
jgi:hypothetical protein